MCSLTTTHVHCTRKCSVMRFADYGFGFRVEADFSQAANLLEGARDSQAAIREVICVLSWLVEYSADLPTTKQP